ncbi:histamine H3 receptor-like [Lytechinus pictus]|uniref:histamine H3 receptor-like n=1 Tax=Lytechinus pictus TaxID=7653 RepID=UPI0030B9DA21
MSSLVGTTVASEILTDVVTLVTLAGDGEDIVLSSPYSPDVVIVLSLVIAVVIFMTVIGNLFVVIAFCTTTKLRTYNNYFILGLAIADLLVGAVDMPLFAVVIIMGRWPFSAVFCDIFSFLDHAFTYTSMVLVTLISLDRCVAVSDPFRHRQHWRRRSRAILIIAIGYILPFIWFGYL